jgi:hypothetical protein
VKRSWSPVRGPRYRLQRWCANDEFADAIGPGNSCGAQDNELASADEKSKADETFSNGPPGTRFCQGLRRGGALFANFVQNGGKSRGESGEKKTTLPLRQASIVEQKHVKHGNQKSDREFAPDAVPGRLDRRHKKGKRQNECDIANIAAEHVPEGDLRRAYQSRAYSHGEFRARRGESHNGGGHDCRGYTHRKRKSHCASHEKLTA